jgi:thioredoxin-dependent peroxiredoxin
MATIYFHGQSVSTFGELPSVGCVAPDFLLTNAKLEDITLARFVGKKIILNIVPSIDTPVCAASARKFNEKANKLKNTIVLLISADLPFAQCRFCEVEGLQNVISLSTFRSNFADLYGVKLIDSILAGLTARAVIVIDENNQIRYSQLINELTDEPDYEAILMAAK